MRFEDRTFPELPDGDEPTGETFSGTERDTEKLALCRHIGEMADGIRRVAPYHIGARGDDVNDNTRRDWVLTLELRSPMVLLSLPLRKRLCEMMLAADQVAISAVPEKDCTRFAFAVTGLWK